jgi:hypothetical protein
MIARRWKPAVALCLLSIISLLFFHQLAFSGKILARGDTLEYFYPYWDARNAAFRDGRLPQWTPNLFLGAPLLANPQIGAYYPLNWLTAPFRAPTAISLSILAHSALAAFGACWLYREAVSKRWLPALTAGVVYAFSGHLGAHVEQINQLQGLAWMPVLFALYQRALRSDRPARDLLALAIIWTLQIFSGHTQTVFISGLGLSLFALAQASGAGGRGARLKAVRRALLILGGGFALALALALPQLLPSLELLRLSNRSGGFDLGNATAFSLPPSLLGRALLPSYDGQLFGEYIGYIGLIALGLALWASLSQALADRRRIWLLLAAIGLGLALGRYNPLYILLAELPPFSLFRAPARFLALFALGSAMLAGLGIESLALDSSPKREGRRRIALVAAALALLIALTAFVLRADPQLIFGDSTISGRGLLHWLGAALILVALLLMRHRWPPIAAFALITAELFLASQHLPYNDLAPPEVYLGQRFTISQLLAKQAEEPVAGRMLAISPLRFDPGDIVALRKRYDRLSLDAAAQFHALDAVKKGETLMPNLPLTWGIPTIDGYGGGITPTRHYALFSSLLLPAAGEFAVDGRLGERLARPECRGACIPDINWLRATDTRYIITDKVHDIWHDDIAYDTALARFWTDAAYELPAVDADQARILHKAPLANADNAIALPDGMWLTIVDIADSPALRDVWQEGDKILAVTLVNSRHPQIFFQLQPPPFKRALSSDIKLYQLPPGERAFLAGASHILPDDARGDEEALRLLRAGAPLVLQGGQAQSPAAGGQVEIIAYEETLVKARVNARAPAYLVLKDAFYPGWEATVNGRPTPINRANLLFRAVAVPAGESAVVFRFAPALWRIALYIGIALWIIAAIVLLKLSTKESGT